MIKRGSPELVTVMTHALPVESDYCATRLHCFDYELLVMIDAFSIQKLE